MFFVSASITPYSHPGVISLPVMSKEFGEESSKIRNFRCDLEAEGGNFDFKNPRLSHSFEEENLRGYQTPEEESGT